MLHPRQHGPVDRVIRAVRAPGTEQHIAPAGVSPLLWELGKRPETRAQAGHRARIASPMFRGGRGPRAPASPKTTAETLRRHRKSHARGAGPGRSRSAPHVKAQAADSTPKKVQRTFKHESGGPQTQNYCSGSL